MCIEFKYIPIPVRSTERMIVSYVIRNRVVPCGGCRVVCLPCDGRAVLASVLCRVPCVR